MPDDTPGDFIDFSPDSKPKAPVTEEKFTQQTAKMFTLVSALFLADYLAIEGKLCKYACTGGASGCAT